MSRANHIRWRTKDYELLKKVVKNFNAKVDYHYKKAEGKNPPPQKDAKTMEGSALPLKMSYKELSAEIATRAEFNRVIKQLKKFSEKGQEELVPLPESYRDDQYITKWGLNAIKEVSKHETKMVDKRRKQYEEREVRLLGGKVDEFLLNGKRIGSTTYHQLQPLKTFLKSGTSKGAGLRYKQILRRSLQGHWNQKDIQCRDNYIKAIEWNFGELGKSKEIIKAIKSMTVEEFIEVFESEIGEFEWVYHESEAQQMANLEALERIWLKQEHNVVMNEDREVEAERIYGRPQRYNRVTDKKYRTSTQRRITREQRRATLKAKQEMKKGAKK